MMSDMENRIRILNELKEEGFLIEMDDFGSGYSSLNMLNEIPVDVLKLDMRFLYRFSQEGRSSSILSSIVSMTKNLRISVIAEGVETEEQARFLAGIGCRQAQGFFYHKPMTGEAFLALIRREMQEISNIHDLESAKLYLSQLLTPAILVSRQGDRMEMLACNATDGFSPELTQPYYEIYRMFAEEACASYAVQTKDPYIGITQHKNEDGSYYVTAINYDSQTRKPDLMCSEGWHWEILYGDPAAIPACDGVVLHVKRK